jgi:hypothetical protein
MIANHDLCTGAAAEVPYIDCKINIRVINILGIKHSGTNFLEHAGMPVQI